MTTMKIMVSKQNSFVDRLLGAHKAILFCLILAAVFRAPMELPFTVEATTADKDKHRPLPRSLRGESILHHHRPQSIVSSHTNPDGSDTPPKIRRKLQSRKRYFARYSGSVGRKSVQRCAKLILEDEDDTDYTVFEVDFEIEVEVDAGVDMDGTMLMDYIAYSQNVNYDISDSSKNDDDVEGCISSLRNMDDILDVEEDRPVSLLQQTLVSPPSSIEGFEERAEESQWNVEAIQADRLPPGSSKVTVCVVDTGIAVNHPGFPLTASSRGAEGNEDSSRIKGHSFQSLQFNSGASGPRLMQWNRDINGHGTHVAGIIFDVIDATRSTTTPSNIELFVVSAFDGNDLGYESDVVRAVRTCIEEAKADVINLSLGNAYLSTFSAGLYSSIVEKGGAIMVAAAGNKSEDADDFQFYPASIPSVISVGAVQRGGSHYPSSIRNNQVELVGPGHEILSTGVRWNEEKSEMEYVYERRSGTSSAAPHVAGAVALLKSHFPTCSNRQIRYAMAKTAVRSESINKISDRGDSLSLLGALTSNTELDDNDGSATNCDSTQGYGSIQVRDALDWMLLQGGCDSWDVEMTSRGGCSTLSGGIIRIQSQDSEESASKDSENYASATAPPDDSERSEDETLSIPAEIENVKRGSTDESGKKDATSLATTSPLQEVADTDEDTGESSTTSPVQEISDSDQDTEESQQEFTALHAQEITDSGEDTNESQQEPTASSIQEISDSDQDTEESQEASAISRAGEGKPFNSLRGWITHTSNP